MLLVQRRLPRQAFGFFALLAASKLASAIRETVTSDLKVNPEDLDSAHFRDNAKEDVDVEMTKDDVEQAVVQVQVQELTRGEFAHWHHGGLHVNQVEEHLERKLQRDAARRSRQQKKSSAMETSASQWSSRASCPEEVEDNETQVIGTQDITHQIASQSEFWILRPSKKLHTWDVRALTFEDGVLNVKDEKGSKSIAWDLACVWTNEPTRVVDGHADSCFTIRGMSNFVWRDKLKKPKQFALNVCWCTDTKHCHGRNSTCALRRELEKRSVAARVRARTGTEQEGDQMCAVSDTSDDLAHDATFRKESNAFVQGLRPYLGVFLCFSFEMNLASIGLPGVLASVGTHVMIGYSTTRWCWTFDGRIGLRILWGLQLWGKFYGISALLDASISMAETPVKETSLPKDTGRDNSVCYSYSPFPVLWSWLRRLVANVRKSDTVQAELNRTMAKERSKIEMEFGEYKSMFKKLQLVPKYSNKDPLNGITERSDLWSSSMQGRAVWALDNQPRHTCWFQCLSAKYGDAKPFDAQLEAKREAVTIAGDLFVAERNRTDSCFYKRRGAPSLRCATLSLEVHAHDILTSSPLLEATTLLRGRIGFGRGKRRGVFQSRPERVWPYRYIVARAPGLMAAASAMEEAFYRFQRRLPFLAEQILDRLEEPPVDPGNQWMLGSVDSDSPNPDAPTSLFFESDGRFLARLPSNFHQIQRATEEAEVDVAGERSDVSDDTGSDMEFGGRATVDEVGGEGLHEELREGSGVGNFLKVSQKSRHRQTTQFWMELGMSVANLFVRAVGDLQALWGIYFADNPAWDGQCDSLPPKFALWEEHAGMIPESRVGFGQHTGANTLKGAKDKEDKKTKKRKKLEALENSPWHTHPWISKFSGAGPKAQEEEKFAAQERRAAWIKQGFASGSWEHSEIEKLKGLNVPSPRRWGTVYPHVWCDLVNAATGDSAMLAQTEEERMEVLGPLFDATNPSSMIDYATQAEGLPNGLYTKTDEMAEARKIFIASEGGIEVEVPGTCEVKERVHRCHESEKKCEWHILTKKRLDCERVTLHKAFLIMFPRLVLVIEDVQRELGVMLKKLRACISPELDVFEARSFGCMDIPETKKVEIMQKIFQKMSVLLQRFTLLLGARRTPPSGWYTDSGHNGEQYAKEHEAVGHLLKLMLRDWHLNFAYEPLGYDMRGRLWQFAGKAHWLFSRQLPRREELWFKNREGQLENDRSRILLRWPPVSYSYVLRLGIGFGEKMVFCGAAAGPDKVSVIKTWAWTGNTWDNLPLTPFSCFSVAKNGNLQIIIDRCEVKDKPRTTDDSMTSGVQVTNTIRTKIYLALAHGTGLGIPSPQGNWLTLFKKAWSAGAPSGLAILKVIATHPLFMMIHQMLRGSTLFNKPRYRTRRLSDTRKSYGSTSMMSAVLAIFEGLLTSQTENSIADIAVGASPGVSQYGYVTNKLVTSVTFSEKWMKRGDWYYRKEFQNLDSLAFQNWFDYNLDLPVPGVMDVYFLFDIFLIFELKPWVKALWNRRLKRLDMQRIAKCNECLASQQGFCDLRLVRPDFKKSRDDACRPAYNASQCEGLGYPATDLGYLQKSWDDHSVDPTAYLDDKGQLIFGDWFAPGLSTDISGPCKYIQPMKMGDKSDSTATFYAKRYGYAPQHIAGFM